MATISPTQGLLDSSGKPVAPTTDRTLAGLGFPTTGTNPAGIPNADIAKALTQPNIPATSSPGTTPPPTTTPTAPGGLNFGDPLTKMNFAISGMLTDAKMGQVGINQQQQAGEAQIKTAAAQSDMAFDPSMVGASPTQQSQVRSAEAGVFDTASTNFKDKISYFSKNISDITSALGSFSDMASVTLKATLTPQAIQGVLAAYATGDTSVLNSLPAEARAQVFAELAKNPTVVQQHEEMLKRGILSGGGGSKFQAVYDADGNIIGHTQVIAPIYKGGGGGGVNANEAMGQLNEAVNNLNSGTTNIGDVPGALKAWIKYDPTYGTYTMIKPSQAQLNALAQQLGGGSPDTSTSPTSSTSTPTTGSGGSTGSDKTTQIITAIKNAKKSGLSKDQVIQGLVSDGINQASATKIVNLNY